MTALTHSTAIVVIPPEEVWPAIQEIRQQHDRKMRRWMPHITLIYPFLPMDEFPAVREQLVVSAASIPAFELTLAEFQTFRHRRENYTVWLRPEPEKPLVDLYRSLCEASVGPADHFVPHLSVGQVQSKRDMVRLIDELQVAWEPLRFNVDGVSLIYRRDPPDDVFRVAETIPLADSNQR
jgi:RNA 2',3'-cyclic 3'-phosphodiesterase